MLYPDGRVERRPQFVDDGIAILADHLAELASAGTPLEELCDHLLARMLPGRLEDDVALLAVRHPSGSG